MKMKFVMKIKLEKHFYPQIETMSIISSYLYNEINYRIRQNYLNHQKNEKSDKNIFYSKSYMNFKESEFYQEVKKLNNYKQLPNSIRQNTAINLHDNYISFFELLSLKQKNKYKEKINLPHYKKRGINHKTLLVSKGNFRIKEDKDYYYFSLTSLNKCCYYNPELEEIKKEFKDKITFVIEKNSLKNRGIIDFKQLQLTYQNGDWYSNCVYDSLTPEEHHLQKKKKEIQKRINKEIKKLKIKKNLDNKEIKRIKKKKMEEIKEEEKIIDLENIRGIDPGINNIISYYDSKGKRIVFNGKPLKSKNRFYNKIKSHLQSKLDILKNQKKTKTNEYQKLQKRINSITRDRNRYVRDYLHKVSFNIVKKRHENGIKTLVIGHNKEWKKEVNIGKRNNQNFVNIPHSQLFHYIKYKGEFLDINVIEQEESYTSKIDHLANEPIKKHPTYLGKRKHRGLFFSSTGFKINRDINGRIGIRKKHIEKYISSQDFLKKILDSKGFLSPLKFNLYS